MEKYLSTKETAEKWGVSERRVGQYCSEGRIQGAQRVGKAWAVPYDAEKPADPRRERKDKSSAVSEEIHGGEPKAELPGIDQGCLMPLMNTDFAPGHCLEAVKAMEILEKEGIHIRVVDMHTIKPIDREMIIKSAKETKKLISIEDHSIIGGLGSAIAEVLTEEYPCKLIRLGIKDTFGKSGNAMELLKYFGLTSDEIIQTIKNN